MSDVMLLVMTSYTTACILPDSNVNDYNFTVYSVTNGIDGTTYNGSIATDCCELYKSKIEMIFI